MFKKFSNTIDFPYTSPTRYLTGMTALNIPAPENTGGDWHFSGAFRSSSFPENLKLAGEGLEWNTNALFGEYGIHECSDILRSRGISIPDGVQVFSANHYRAILDMLWRSVSSGRIPQHLAIEDWLDNEEQKSVLFSLLDRFFQQFSPVEQRLISSWIALQK
ncbi:MAG: hypothetical protein ACYCVG_05550 [Leptospirillum sp.]